MDLVGTESARPPVFRRISSTCGGLYGGVVWVVARGGNGGQCGMATGIAAEAIAAEMLPMYRALPVFLVGRGCGPRKPSRSNGATLTR